MSSALRRVAGDVFKVTLLASAAVLIKCLRSIFVCFLSVPWVLAGRGFQVFDRSPTCQSRPKHAYNTSDKGGGKAFTLVRSKSFFPCGRHSSRLIVSGNPGGYERAEKYAHYKHPLPVYPDLGLYKVVHHCHPIDCKTFFNQSC